MTQTIPEQTLTARVLPPSEYPRLKATSSPLAAVDIPAQTPALVVVLERGDQIVAHWVLFDTVHADLLWADPAVRGNPRAAVTLIQQVYTELRRYGARYVYANIEDEELMGSMAERLGFTRLPGVLYGMEIPPQEGM